MTSDNTPEPASQVQRLLTDEQCEQRDEAIMLAVDAVMSWKTIGSLATGFVMTLNKHGWNVRPLHEIAALTAETERLREENKQATALLKQMSDEFMLIRQSPIGAR